VRHFCFFFFTLFCLSANAQWEVVPSGTDSALYCVTYHNGDFLIGGAALTLLSSEATELNFNDATDPYEISFPANNNVPITKIGVVNDNELFIDFNTVWNSVADNNTIFGLRAGVGVDADSNLVILEEYQFDGYADVYIDTTVFEYWTNPDYLSYEHSYIDLGTIAWMIRSTDGGESYDLGTAFDSDFAYLNSAHCSSAKNVGVIDYTGNLHFSSDSGQTFSVHQLPGLPFDFEVESIVNNDFTATGFYFNDNLVGFYASAAESASSIYKIDMETWSSESSGISSEFNWNRITMVGYQFVIAVGDSGMVASSFDQGETWAVENVGTELNLYGVDADDDGNLIIVGDSGLILTNSISLVEGIEIDSEDDLNIIETENGTLQLNASVFPESAPQEVGWSMVNLSGTAAIDQNGLVTAQGNGLVMAVASIPEPPGFTEDTETNMLSSTSGTFFILISGQSLGEQYIFGSDTTICGADVLTVSLPSSSSEVEWSDGSTELSFEISEAGTYWVTVADGAFVRSDSIQVVHFPYPAFSLGEDIIACEGDEVALEAPISSGSYEWSTGSDESSITISEAGEYGLSITLNGCTSSDEVNVSFLAVPEFDLGEDISLCEGESTMLSAPVEGEYIWSTGSTESEIFLEEEGWIVLEIFDGECSFEDSLFLEVKPLPEFSLGADTIICDTASIVLEAFVEGATYEWSDGSESSSIEVDEEGEYGVLVTVNSCSSEDEISVGLINCTLSTSKESLEASFKIFPNPATDLITIEIPENLFGGSVSVYSSTGKLIDQLNQTSIRKELDVSDWSKGIYLIRIEKAGMALTKELVLF